MTPERDGFLLTQGTDCGHVEKPQQVCVCVCVCVCVSVWVWVCVCVCVCCWVAVVCCVLGGWCVVELVCVLLSVVAVDCVECVCCGLCGVCAAVWSVCAVDCVECVCCGLCGVCAAVFCSKELLDIGFPEISLEMFSHFEITADEYMHHFLN